MGKGVKTASGEVVHLRTNYEVKDKLEAFYTGGNVQFSSDSHHMFCACGSAVKVLSVETGRVEHTIEEEEDLLTCFAVSGDNEVLTVAWRSLLLKQYDWKSGKCNRSWKGHLGPVISMTFDPSSTLLATGSSDSTIKVWDCVQQYCTHNFRGSKGLVSLVQFHPSPEELRLYSCSVDCSIRVWDLATSRCIQVLEGHVSAVTAFGFVGDVLLSAGRDKVVHIWETNSGTLRKTLPVFEAVEGLVVVPNEGTSEDAAESGDKIVFATAGDKGVIRFWDASTGQMTNTLQPLTAGVEGSSQTSEDVPQTYTGLLHCRRLESLVAITYDHNIILYSLNDYKKTKQFVGYLDEILDMRFAGEGEQLLAVATNSEQVKVFHQDTYDCQVLTGHSGIVLSLDVSTDKKVLATSSKDNTIRVWRLESSGQFHCVAMGTGHTLAVGAVAVSRLGTSFVVSGSQDLTIKMWSLKTINKWKEGDVPVKLPVKYTQLAHDKDINSIDVSPNDKLIVSGSQDKTAKLWQGSDGSLLGVFRGHRRGIWSVKFSPVDQCVATASGDATIKLWAVADFSCVKTFEGHTNSVLKAVFLTRGMQIASSGNDGLIKLWTIKTSECVTTLDQHTEKVWSLTASSNGDLLISGGADSLVCQWKDVTEQVEEEQLAAKEELVLREQELSNLLQHKDYVRAVGLAITLDQPFRVLHILTELLEEGGMDGPFSNTILSLREDQITTVIKYLNRWNMNAKHSKVAQTVLSVVLRSYPPEKIMEFEDIKQTIEGLIPYTERHFQRLTRLQQLSTFVDYTWQCMKLPLDNSVGRAETRTPVAARAASVSVPADSTTPDEGLFVEDKEPDPSLHLHGNEEDHVTSTSYEDQEEVEVKPKRRKKHRASDTAEALEPAKKPRDSDTAEALKPAKKPRASDTAEALKPAKKPRDSDTAEALKPAKKPRASDTAAEALKPAKKPRDSDTAAEALKPAKKPRASDTAAEALKPAKKPRDSDTAAEALEPAKSKASKLRKRKEVYGTRSVRNKMKLNVISRKKFRTLRKLSKATVKRKTAKK